MTSAVDIDLCFKSFSTLRLIQFMSVACWSVTLYDYSFTLPDEIDLVWSDPISLTSGIYFVLRYLGLIMQMVYVVIGLRSLSDVTQQVSSLIGEGFNSRCLTIIDSQNPQSVNSAIGWVASIYLAAMQCILLLRAYALYKASRRLMYILGVCFVLEMTCVIFSLQWGVHSPRANNYGLLIGGLPWAGFEILLLVLILRASFKHRQATWGATRIGWNPLLRILVRDSSMYFVGFVYSNVLLIICALYIDESYVGVAAGAVIANLLGPRMVLTLRRHLATREQVIYHIDTDIVFATAPDCSMINER